MVDPCMRGSRPRHNNSPEHTCNGDPECTHPFETALEIMLSEERHIPLHRQTHLSSHIMLELVAGGSTQTA